MKEFLCILAFAIFQSPLDATSMLAAPQRKDLCGFWLGLNGDVPVVIELTLNGPGYCSTLAKDGSPATYSFSWLTFSRTLRFEVEKNDSALPDLALEGEMTTAASWGRITLKMTGVIVADGKCSLELKPLSKAEMNLGLVIQAIESTKKKANHPAEPASPSRAGSP